LNRQYSRSDGNIRSFTNTALLNNVACNTHRRVSTALHTPTYIYTFKTKSMGTFGPLVDSQETVVEGMVEHTQF